MTAHATNAHAHHGGSKPRLSAQKLAVAEPKRP
ncbi:hypothetical protein ABH936_002520 [Dermacoccus sp. GAS27A]